MKILLLLLILNCQFLIFNSTAQSPDWSWAKSIGGIDDEGGFSIAIDPSGSGAVYTTGDFRGTSDFDPGVGVFNLTSTSISDIFISKLDSLGNFVWAKAIGGTNGGQAFSISIDAAGSGDIYTTGQFMGTSDFDPGAGVFNLTSANRDIFISKLDSSGNFIWAKQFSGTDGGYGFSIAIDPAGSGDVYITGLFYETTDFDPGPGIFNLTSTANSDIFISKLDSSGNFVWAKRIGGITVGVSYESGNSIAVDPAGSGSVYITGKFQGTVDFDPGVGLFNLTSAGGYDIFISKLDSSGNFVWAKSMGGADTDWGQSIAIDTAGTGDVCVTGNFEGTADFDPGPGIYNFTSAGGYDIFISKFNSSGNFVWANAMGGVSYEYANSIAIDPAGSGQIYTTGSFQVDVDFDPGAGVFNLSTGGIGDPDIFVSKLDGLGNFVWAKSVGGSYDYEYANSIALDASGNAYITGSFDGSTISFGSNILTNADSLDYYSDIFIAKLDTILITGDNEMKNFGNGILISPNPSTNRITISFSLTQSQKVSLKIFDLNGRLISSLSDNFFEAGENKLVWNVENVNAGAYFLQFKTEENLQTKKLLVAK